MDSPRAGFRCIPSDLGPSMNGICRRDGTMSTASRQRPRPVLSEAGRHQRPRHGSRRVTLYLPHQPGMVESRQVGQAGGSNQRHPVPRAPPSDSCPGGQDPFLSGKTMSYLSYLAEGQGFEPWEGCPSLVFKTSAFDRSATPPRCGRVRSVIGVVPRAGSSWDCR